MKFGRFSAKLLGLALAGCVVSGTALAVPVVVFSENFEGGTIPSQISGAGTVEGTQGYSTLGFGSNMLRNDRNPATNTTLTLTGLQSHTSIDINFLLAIINSWDAPGNPHPDRFNVLVDGVSIFNETFNASGAGDSFTPDTGVALSENASLFYLAGQGGDNPNYRDAAYNMGLQSVFNNIAHTAPTLTIDFFASGAGWSGGGDESFALDNLEIVLNVPEAAVPEPASLILLGLGLAGLGFSRRKQKPAA